MFKLKLFSFMTKEASGALFEISFSAEKQVTKAVSNIGFRTNAAPRRLEPRRRFVMSILDAVFEKKPNPPQES